MARERVSLLGERLDRLEYESLLQGLPSGPSTGGPDHLAFNERWDALIRDLVTASNAHPAPADPGHNAQLGGGRWRLTREVGQGGFARVWKAWDRDLKRDVAVKVLLVNNALDRSKVSRFFRGAQVMAELQHPNIVTVLDSGRVDSGVGYYVMDYLPGAAAFCRWRRRVTCSSHAPGLRLLRLARYRPPRLGAHVYRAPA